MKSKTRIPLTDQAVRGLVGALLQQLGVKQAARSIGLHQQTLLAIAAGLPVRPGSFALAREFFMREAPNA